MIHPRRHFPFLIGGLELFQLIEKNMRQRIGKACGIWPYAFSIFFRVFNNAARKVQFFCNKQNPLPHFGGIPCFSKRKKGVMEKRRKKRQSRKQSKVCLNPFYFFSNIRAMRNKGAS